MRGCSREVCDPLLGKGTVVYSRHNHALPDGDESIRHREGDGGRAVRRGLSRDDYGCAQAHPPAGAEFGT